MRNTRKNNLRPIRTLEPLEDRRLLAIEPFQSGFNIQIIPGPGLLDDDQVHFPEALAAIDRAVNLWESVIRDPITVTIEIDIQDIDVFATIEQPTLVPLTYNTARTALINDGISEGDDDILLSLPQASDLTFNLPADFSIAENQLVFTKANAKALGIPGLDEQFGAVDLSIVYDRALEDIDDEDGIPWDFDERDGISNPFSASGLSFTAEVAQTIGFALGFVSSIDSVGRALFELQQDVITPTPMDLFRFENTAIGFDPSTPEEFATFPRQLTPESDHIFDDLQNEWALESDVIFENTTLRGSLFESDFFFSQDPVGLMQFIGLGDEFSTFETFGRPDWRVLDLIGYDIAAEPTSDLVGDFFQVVGDVPLQAGETIDVEFSISNLGEGIAGPFDVGFYLIDDSIDLDGRNYQEFEFLGIDEIGEFTFEGLLPSDTTPIFSTSLRLPTSSLVYTGLGNYKIGVVIDPNADLFEGNEFNNAGVGELFDFETVFISPIPLPPDLAGSTFDIAEAEATTGEEITVTFDVSNLGQGQAGNFQVDVLLSRDNQVGPGDFILGSVSFDGLNRNTDSPLITRTFTLPEVNHPIWALNGSGDYFVGVFSDANDQILEASELNNNSLGLGIDFDVIDVTVSDINPPPGPDPDVRGLVFGVFNDPATAGGNVVVDFIVENNGATDVGQFTVDFYLSANSTITTDDFFLGQRIVGGIETGLTTGVLTQVLELPAAANAFWNGTGTYHIGMIIDRDDNVAESNESNNSNRGLLIDNDDLTVIVPTVPADLRGTAFNVVQEPLEVGDNLDLLFTVENAATGTAGPFSVRFFLSSNSLISTSDQQIGQFDFTGLAGNTSQANSINLTLPTDPIFYGNGDDTYFIGMIVDAGGAVAESNENNNSNRGELVDFDSVIITTPPVLGQGGPGFGNTIGAFNADTGTFFLRNSNDSGNADIDPFNLASGGAVNPFGGGPLLDGGPLFDDIPITGDWNGDGVDTVGIYNPGTAEFRLINDHSGDGVDTVFTFGLPGWLPIAGDWNNDGIDTIGVYNPTTATYFLNNTNSGGAGDVPAFNYGIPGWTPIAGDWDGNGTDTIGAYNSATATFFLRNSNTSGVADVPAFNYGIAGWTPLVGDWDNNGTDTVGVHNIDTATSFLRNSNDSGVADVPAFNYGIAGWIPIVGNWTNNVQPLVAAAGLNDSTSDVPSLSSDQLQEILSEAAAKWAAAGLDAAGVELLTSAEVRIADLPGATLGLAVDNRIYLDSNAAGHGWFVDSTPAQDEEYELLASEGLKATSGAAAEGIDLLSVVQHEFGHLLGLDDHAGDPDELMYESIARGERRAASASEIDKVLAGGDW